MSSTLSCILAGAAGAVVATVAPLLLSTSSAQTQLLPFQGRLTDANGNAVGDGARVVEFKMYDAPTGGNVKWAGEVHKLSVNGGLVNTMLGSKASLGGVDFGTATFLQITVDANGDGAITAADPPLLPRQNVVPAVFAMEAGNSRKLNGADWTALMVDGSGAATGDPGSGFVRGAKIQAGGVTTTQLAPNAVTAAQIADGSIGTAELADGSVTNPKLAIGAIGSSAILDGSVLAEDLGSGIITSEKIRDGTIQSADIALEAITPAKLKREIMYFVEEKGSNESVSATVGWSSRQLNKLAFSTSAFASLGANGAVTLQPGKYLVEATASSNGADGGMLILRDVAADSTLVAGSESSGRYILASFVISAQNKGLLRGLIEVNGGPKSVDLQQYAVIVAYPASSYGSAGGTGMGAKGAKWIASSLFIEKIN